MKLRYSASTNNIHITQARNVSISYLITNFLLPVIQSLLRYHPLQVDKHNRDCLSQCDDRKVPNSHSSRQVSINI